MKSRIRVRVNANGGLVIPPSFRRVLGIKVGDEVLLRVEDNELRVISLQNQLARAQRLVRKHVKPGVSLVDELIAERRKAARNK